MGDGENFWKKHCSTQPSSSHTLTEEEEVKRRALVAQAKIQKGQVSRARHVLTGSPLAPKNNATFDLLQGRRPQEPIREIPQRVLEYSPKRPVVLSRKIFTKCLQEAPSGSSPCPGGCTNEMLRVCLDDGELFQLLLHNISLMEAHPPKCARH